MDYADAVANPCGSFLLVVTRDDQTETHAFHQDVVSIGRSRDADLMLQDRLISRKHCRVERREDTFVLIDDGAANPVRLRGMPVECQEIRVGETFVAGNYSIKLALPVQDLASIDETRMGGDSLRSSQDLNTFLDIAKALNEELELSRLLTQIVDAAIDLAGAERGFLLLGDSDSATVEVARNFAQEEVLSPEYKISRTIAQRVRESGVAELTTNAQEDDRYRALRSVADLRLRSVLCIPIRISGQVGGVLYVDNRLQQQAFQEREKSLLISLADQAAIAIRNARTMEELRRKQDELEAAVERVAQLNGALKGQLQERTVELSQIREELSAAAQGRNSKYEYKQIIGQSRAMRTVLQLLDKYIEAEDPVLILGESGTGKELVAKAVHGESHRKDQPFVTENCAALPESLLESELFGYAKGAFTGANTDKKGLLEAASGGVLFLDEVGDMPLDLQKKLLRVLQEGEVRPLGGSRTVKVDVRLITATNRNLEEMVAEGDFREDLYYRLNVLPVNLPPLRERRDDIPHLVRRFLGVMEDELGRKLRVSPEAMELLMAHRWPGNVRELQNEIRRAALLGDGVILDVHLSPRVREPEASVTNLGLDDNLVPAEKDTTLPDMVKELEIREIVKSVRQAAGNKSRAAEMLGVSRFALQRKLEKYELGDDGSAANSSSGA